MATRDTFILSRSEVEGLVGMSDAIETVEAAFRAHGAGTATLLTRNFELDPTSLVSIKAGYLRDTGTVALKTLGLVVLSSSDQLRRPLAILEQGPITFLRTGAAGAVAARKLAREDSKTVGVIGTGKQGRAQLLGLSEVFKLTRVSAWSPTPNNREIFAKEMSQTLGIEVRAVSECRAAVEGMDILVTATRAQAPLFPADWVSKGTHVNAVGTDRAGAQELPTELFSRAEIFADDLEQSLWMGAVNVPITQGRLARKDVRGTLGQVLHGSIKGRSSSRAVTVFDCSGVGFMDAALALRTYERAIASAKPLRRMDWLG